MAQTDNYDRKQKVPTDVHNKVVASAQHVYVGSAVGVKPADGLLYKMGAHVTLKCIGVAREEVTGDGILKAEVREGVFPFTNSASSDLIAETDVGQLAYAVDDDVVAKTSAGGTRAVMGVIVAINADSKVHVQCGVALAGDSVESSVAVNIPVATLVGSNTYRAVSPVAGIIKKIYSVINGVLTTGDATLTGKINGAAITTGVVTITQAGSAAGDVDSATPTALNTVAQGDSIEVTVGGTNATASTAQVTVVIEAQ